MVKAVFPGSFDPPTYGHLNIIERASSLYEELLVVIAVNRSKDSLFTPDERVAFMKKLMEPYPNVSVHTCDTLVVEFAKKHDCKVLIRGVRSVQDFSYEFELSIMNKGLDPDIETIFMPTDTKFFVLRSSAIKELASFGGRIETMVPPIVAECIRKKFSTAYNL